MIGWNLFFVALNLFQIGRLVRQRMKLNRQVGSQIVEGAQLA